MVKKLRRRFIRDIGIGTVGVSTSTVAGQKKKIEKKNATRTAKELISEGKYKRAERALERESIDHFFSVFRPSESSDGNVSIQNGRYVSPDDHDGTELFMGIIENDRSNYDVMNHWHLIEEGNVLTPDNVCPTDGAAIFWNKNHWQPTSVGRSNFRTDHDYVEYGDYSGNGGVLAEVNVLSPDSDNSRDELFGAFEIELEAVSSRADQYSIKGTYTHTWINSAKKTCGGINVGLSLGAGSISINGDVQDWSMGDDVSL